MPGCPDFCRYPSSRSALRGLLSCLVVLSGWTLAQCSPAGAAEPQPGERDEAEFAKHVRTTPPLSPAEERRGFRVPDGFEVQLVAAEPQIAKPMNLAFDARGRLWVTSSREYPFPVEAGQSGRDTIKILEDQDGDGFAESVTTFADGLNIPIGLYPYRDGVICFSIPNILFLRDTDGDGRADKREVLYGPFDTTRDTHGMCNGFTRGFDGWLYACHGFNNRSRVAGDDGHEIQMNSGNTFRMRLDGSRIEHYTHGQVNPFGMAFDPLGDLFTADCHTKPVTLLLQGGYSPSFGAPHDGLGFVPPVMQHLHGSTAIGGIAIYHADQFPKAFHGNAFGGNVMTGKINRNALRRHGGSVRAVEQADFLVASDPWFRPVDLQIGPDGALYVADFYNRIIGHYEVPLDHPGRDRHRGRIWRIVYRGDETSPPTRTEANPSDDLGSLVAQFESHNLTRRKRACDTLLDRHADAATEPVRELLRTTDRETAAAQALWYLQRAGTLREQDLERAVTADSVLVRVHAQRILRELDPAEWPQLSGWVARGLNDPAPTVVRAAAMAISVHPRAATVEAVLRRLTEVKPADVHLRHALRMALRSQLRDESRFREAASTITEPARQAEIASVCVAIPTATAADYLVRHLDRWPPQQDPNLVDAIRYAARHASADTLPLLIETARDSFEGQPAIEEELLRAMEQGRVQRGQDARSPQWTEWAVSFVERHLGVDASGNLPATRGELLAWSALQHPGHTSEPQAWPVTRRRRGQDGGQPLATYSSFPLGEAFTGIFRSGRFQLPERFSFALAGHDGSPDEPAAGRNFARLVDADTGETLARWPAPRNDVAQRLEWESGEHAGKTVRVELVDGDDGNAYAWLAAGRFSLAPLNPSELQTRGRKAAEIAAELDLSSARPLFAELLRRGQHDPASERLFALALLPGEATALRRVLAEALGVTHLPEPLRQRLRDRLLADDRARPNDAVAADGVLAELMASLPSSRQLALARTLSSDPTGLAPLIRLVEQGTVSASVLTDSATRQQWEVVADETQKRQLQDLADSAPATDEQRLQQVADYKAQFRNGSFDPQAGKALFAKNCAVCHQVAGEGAEVGPNLDGIGNRGVDRLLEDILLPHRNVDVAFRSHVLLTSDGKVLSGLIKGEQGTQVLLVTSDGKSVSIDKDRIEQRKPSQLSPMPGNFGETLAGQKFLNVLGYVLSLRE